MEKKMWGGGLFFSFGFFVGFLVELNDGNNRYQGPNDLEGKREPGVPGEEADGHENTGEEV